MQAEIQLPVSQALALFAKVIRKVSNRLQDIQKAQISAEMALPKTSPSQHRDGNQPKEMVANGDGEVEAPEDVRDDRDPALREKQREMIQSLDLNKCVYPLDTFKLLIAHQDAHLRIGMRSINVTSTGPQRKPRFRSSRHPGEPLASRR